MDELLAGEPLGLEVVLLPGLGLDQLGVLLLQRGEALLGLDQKVLSRLLLEAQALNLLAEVLRVLFERRVLLLQGLESGKIMVLSGTEKRAGCVFRT